MSSSTHHITSNRNNRNLQKSLRRHDQFFLQSYPYGSLRYYPESIDVQKADKMRRRKIILSIIPVVVICILTFLLISKIHVDSKSRSIKEYHLLVNEGEHSFNEKSFAEARIIFQAALEIYPNGKKANLGLTKCLLVSCSDLGLNCQYAKEYSDIMYRSGLLSKNEIKNLEDLKKVDFKRLDN